MTITHPPLLLRELDQEPLPEEASGVLLRLQLPQTLMEEIIRFQIRMNLYHSAGAIRYLLYKGLMIETCLEKR